MGLYTPATPLVLAPSKAHRPDEQGVVPAGARATDAMFAETEARLGLVIPEALKVLYREHNGGYVGACFVPRGDPSSEEPADWRGVLARRYDHIRPLHQWMPVPEAYHWADPVEDADLIPAQSGRYIVLAIRYEDVTYLDYSQPGPPGVSVVDFQRDSERSANSMHFADVESFLAAVHRRTDLTRRR